MVKPLLTAILISITAIVNLFAQTSKKFEVLGDSLYNEKNYTGAITQYTNAINTEKDHKRLAVLFDMRGLSFYDLKRYDEALADENRAISNDSKYGAAYWNKAAAYDALKNYSPAIDNYSRAILLYGKDSVNLSKLYNYRGYARYKSKLYSESIKDDSAAISFDPENEMAYWHRAMSNHILGNYELSNKDYLIAIKYEDDRNDLATIYNNMASNSRNLKDYKKAIEYEDLAISLNPDNGNYYWNRGLNYQSLDAYQFAIDDFDKAIPFFKTDSNSLAILYNNKAFANVFFGKPETAIIDNAGALNYNPQFKFAYRIKGLAYSMIGKHKDAANAYKQAMKFHYDEPVQYNTLYNDWVGEKFYNTNADSLILYCDTAVLLNPKNLTAYYVRGKVYLKKLKNTDLSRADFNKVIALDTARNSVSYIFSQFYLGKNDLALTLANDKILKSKTDNDLSVAYYNIACLYSLMNKKDEAINYLQFALNKGYNQAYALADDDFDNIREDKKFKNLVLLANNSF